MNIPELYYPFVSRMNPNAEGARMSLSDWLNESGLARTDREREAIDAFGLYRLAGMMYPEGAGEALSLYARFLGWIFVVDDWFDEWEGSSNLAERLRQALIALDLGLPDASGQATHAEVPGVVAFASLLGELTRRGAPVGALETFRSSVVDFLAASQWELQNRSARRVPPLPEYWEMGSSTVGVLPCVALLDALDGARPESLPERQRLLRVCSLAVRVTNDILSFEKELRRGEVNNLLLVLMQDRHVGVEEAAALAAQYSDDLVRLYLECEGRARGWAEGTNGRLRNMMRASYDWGRWATTRYSACSESEMVSALLHPG